MTNYFSIIALVIIGENITKIANFSKIFYFSFKIKHAPKHALRVRRCYNHLAVNSARENDVLNQSARAIFDNHQCNFTKKG